MNVEIGRATNACFASYSTFLLRAFLHWLVIALPHVRWHFRVRFGSSNNRALKTKKILGRAQQLASGKSFHNHIFKDIRPATKTKKRGRDEVQTSHGPRFKEAWFLYIPANLANPNHHCIQDQRITCVLCAAQCVSFSMFYHRVLPPPSNPTKAPVAGLRPPNRDTLLENSIMMNENQKIHADDRGTSLAQQHRPSIPNKHIPESSEDVNSPTSHSTRSSARLSRKRESPGHPPAPSDQLAAYRLPSTSAAGSSSRSNDSPSQLCLCQPDPKVPRPRNGELLSPSCRLCTHQWYHRSGPSAKLFC